MVITLTSLADGSVISKGVKFKSMNEAKSVLIDWYGSDNFYYEDADPTTENYWSRKPFHTKNNM